MNFFTADNFFITEMTIICLIIYFICSRLPYDLSDAFAPQMALMFESEQDREKRHERMKRQHKPMIAVISFCVWFIGVFVFVFAK